MAFSHKLQALVEDYIFSGGIFSMSVFQYTNEEKSSQVEPEFIDKSADISMGCVSHLSINVGKSNPNKNKTDSIPSSIDNKVSSIKKEYDQAQFELNLSRLKMKECDAEISAIVKEQQKLQHKISDANVERKKLENKP
ncbi:structural maintenance of chromosomes protein 2-2-like isoform X2 [Magnolia sinica]|uniref:structural maintenance of chromosomes protein 2-2-like isoform X2 n=1 Tax=Magnolia sinica TaxID=86752 RepID=UPI00265A6C31|nr:structural maintenance of chromosomes protein 2-2-like isoform X2 [Magnolia sinica]XP_058077379.1 structural maintenance of chromosomes protein 2-2-like isoform X2 [Magnolia sinica]